MKSQFTPKYVRLRDESKPNSGVSEIIPRKLYLGTTLDVANGDLLFRYGITHILDLNLDTHDSNPTSYSDTHYSYQKPFECLRIPLTATSYSDTHYSYQKPFECLRIPLTEGMTDLRSRFMQIFDFIDKGQCVFVHCNAGNSASDAIVVGYLMHKNGYSYEKAMAKAKESCPGINPHFQFQLELKAYSEEIQKKKGGYGKSK